jgi:hypothetical protein
MKIYKIADGNGYEEELEPGTTKSDAEMILAALPAGWTLTSVTKDAPKPPRQRLKSTYGKHDRHGHWPTSAAIPREESLVRVLKSPVRVRMNDDPVVTMHLDPTDRPVSK